MIVKGIIKSIDYSGNTCTVRIPIFESAANENEVVVPAILSTLPGIYNGYKEEDVVFIAFENNDYDMPVVIGKLYLGVENEKNDPRGAIVCNNITAAQPISIPISSQLTLDNDPQHSPIIGVDKGIDSYKSIADLAKNLQKQDEKLGSLSVKVIDDGENLGAEIQRLTKENILQTSKINQNAESITAEVSRASDAEGALKSQIKQTADDINAEVSKKIDSSDETKEQRGLGWNLNTENWKINAKDTVTNENGETEVKNINIVTIDRNGMSIAGDLKLSGYPRNITVLYAQTGPKEDYPELYKFTEAKFPVPFPSVGEDKDKTWYYGKYIKIEEKYVLIFKENFEDYPIAVGTTKAYNREINPEWKTEAPGRSDGKYIWQWTHTEIYSFDGNKWSEKDDDKIACITGADGKDGAPGKDGYNTVTVMLYKRSKTSISGEQISDDLYYKFSDQKLYKNEGCTIDYDLPEGWSYTINGAGSSSNGDLYCIAAVAHSNTDSYNIQRSAWVGPTLYVENGADGQPGVYIKEVKQWYILKASSFPEPGSEQTPESIKPEDNAEPTYNPAPTSTTLDEWMSTPPEAVNGYNIWTCYGSIFSDDIPSDSKKRHIEYSIPVKDAAYALAQGKTTNYYSPTEPIYNIKKGDCWFDTGYVNVGALKNKTDYLGKFVISTTGDILVEQDENDSTRYIPNAAGSTRLIKITPENIDTLIKNKTIVVDTTEVFETGNLKQCSSLDANGKATWTDIAGELVTNKLTANYINAMDITAKKITILQDNKDEQSQILFKADGTSNNSEVNIGGFTVDSNRLYAGTPGSGSGIELSSYLAGLIAYKSNNQGVTSSYAVSKITVNKDITNLTVYIRSYAEPDYDYTIISNPNVSSYPTLSSSSDVKAHTSSNQNSDSTLAGYTKVEYYDLKQNDWIYVVYVKDHSRDEGTDAGYFLIPETADVSISNVGDYYFVRDSAFDIKGASIKVGKNFSVDKDGNVFASSLNAPNLQIKEVNCAPTLRASSKNNYTKLGNWYILPGSDNTIIELTPRTTISTTMGGDGRSKFAWLYKHADEYTNSDTVNLTYETILNAVSNSGWGSGAPDSLQPNCLTLGAPWVALSPDYSYYNNYAYTQVTGGELGGLHFGVGNIYAGSDAELMCPLLPIWDWGSQGVWSFRSHNKDQTAWGSGIALDRSGSYVSGKVNSNAGTGNTWTLVGTWATQSAITVLSDKNAKNTINELSDKYTNFFNNLKPVSFKYNDGTSNRLHIGFIAQDIEQALAEADIPAQEFAGLVIKRADDDSTSYGLRYSEFIALNTAQIQKLNAKVSSLEDTIAELRAEIADLKN